MSYVERGKARKQSIFLVRNIDKVRQLRSRLSQASLDKNAALVKSATSEKGK